MAPRWITTFCLGLNVEMVLEEFHKCRSSIQFYRPPRLPDLIRVVGTLHNRQEAGISQPSDLPIALFLTRLPQPSVAPSSTSPRQLSSISFQARSPSRKSTQRASTVIVSRWMSIQPSREHHVQASTVSSGCAATGASPLDPSRVFSCVQ